MAIYIGVKFKIAEPVKDILDWVNTDLNEKYGVVWNESLAFHTKNFLGYVCTIEKDSGEERIHIESNFDPFRLSFFITNSNEQRSQYIFESSQKGNYCYYRGRKSQFFKSSFLPNLTPNFFEVVNWNWNVNIFSDEEEDIFISASSQILSRLYSERAENE